jgi:NAD+ kinase
MTVIDPNKRPVNVSADFTEIKSIKCATICKADDVKVELLFDPDHALEERVMREQFMV